VAKAKREKTAQRSEIHTLHRYFIWADRMRWHLDHQILPQRKEATETMFVHPYMSYWYGGMFVVIEGWKRLGLKDTEIDLLLSRQDLIAALERHRHGSFHYHPEYFDDKLLGFMMRPDAAVWIRQLREAMSRWFLAWSAAGKKGSS
jgi:hypothetical protein